MLSKQELRKLQLAELDILKVFVEICKRNNLKYFIIGGTLLGAIRHRGFIPWDDDIDVAMPRDDYEKLLDILKEQLSEPYGYLHYSVSETYREYSLKIIHNTIFCYENKLDVEKSKTNLWIDILPLDAVPNNKFAYTIFKMAVYFWKAMLSFKNIDTIKNNKKRPLIERTLIKFAQIVPVKKVISRNFVMNALDKTIKSCDYETSQNVGTFMGAYRFREVVPKKYFGVSSKCDFEGMQLIAPEKIDDYLHHIYGDYMELPPEDKRCGHIVKILFK